MAVHSFDPTDIRTYPEVRDPLVKFRYLGCALVILEGFAYLKSYLSRDNETLFDHCKPTLSCLLIGTMSLEVAKVSGLWLYRRWHQPKQGPHLH